MHMGIAVVSVGILIWLALGRRESGIVMLAIPATLALTLTVFYLYGYTLNRITLFALIFSIGILVDDAIVVVENIARHARLPENRGRDLADVAVRAVDEVGNPTILATMTVIAAILPMAFVGGLMGPYMRPIPIGASAAMIFSLLVAFIVTPWATDPALEARARRRATRPRARLDALLPARDGRAPARRARCAPRSSAGVVVLLLGAMALVAVKWVRVKMLPFDNKSEFQVIVDMPEGTTLEQTDRVTQALADVDPHAARGDDLPDVRRHRRAPTTSTASCATTSCARARTSPTSRSTSSSKGERKAQSHAIAKRVRDAIAAHRRALRRARQGRRGAARARRCSRRSSPRSTARTTTRDIAIARQVREHDGEDRRASSTSTGTSRTTSRSTASSSTRRRRRSTA